MYPLQTIERIIYLRNDFPCLSNSQISLLIDEWIHSQRDRQIMRRRLIDGITIESLAEEMDMSDAQIKRIVHRRVDELKAHQN